MSENQPDINLLVSRVKEMLYLDGNEDDQLIDTYVKTLKTLHDENPKWFMQALLCIDMKITPANIKANEYQALELTHAKFLEDKAKHISKEYLEMYEDIRDNGATYRVE